MPNAAHTRSVSRNPVCQEVPPEPSARHHRGGVRAGVGRPVQPANDRKRRCHETPKELALANRVALPEQLSASIAEINQPISAVVMNAEAAPRLLLVQPPDTEAVRRLLACIVKDGMRTGDNVSRTRALIKKAQPRIET
jgi:C4-dicarboxylate-specific signal transduction histidine kinase